MPEKTTTITVDVEVWQHLLSLKREPGESHNDVLRRELGLEGDDAGEGARDETDDTQDAPTANADSGERAPSHDDLLNAAYDGMERADERAAIGSVALSWLQSRDGTVTASDFKAALYQQHQLEDESEDTWWRKNARPAITAARDADLVDFHGGKKTYEFVGE